MSPSKYDTESSPTGSPKERTFEQALSELEERVRLIDKGDLPLDDALRKFEEGVALIQECHEKLDTAERRIVELTEGPSGVQEKELAPPSR